MVLIENVVQLTIFSNFKKSTMKSFILVMGMAMLTAILPAQDFITYSGKGKVILTNGDTLAGILAYSLSYPGRVSVKEENKKAVNFNAKEVDEFFLNENHYLPVQFKGEITVGGDITFAMLLNDEHARIRLFRYETQPKIVTGGQIPLTTTYYCALTPNLNEVYMLSHSLVNPSKKLVKYFEDCPELVQKILEKTEGYSYGMMSSNENRLDIIERVNKEYSSCK
jgi:hypothetical protein